MKPLSATDDGASQDIVGSTLDELRALLPDAFTERSDADGSRWAVDFDILRDLLGDNIEQADERYSFTWHGKARARRIAQTQSMGCLRPKYDASFHWDTTSNVVVEGDNLEVLKLLQKSYHRRVKTIFIDPPYNTGREFIYPDRFADNLDTYLQYTGQVSGANGLKLSANTETSGRFHTTWLNMMYPRVKLAQQLLRDDGVLFVTIDDGEAANLRKLCDEVFGEENFIANVVWQKKYTRANDAKWFSDNHDHVLCYARSKDHFTIRPLPRSAEQEAAYSNPDDHPKGPWKATPLHAKSGSNTSAYTFANGVRWQPPTGTYRRFNDEAMARMDAEDEIWFGDDGRQTPQRKSFLSDVKQGVTPITIWPYDEVGHNHEASNELKALDLGGLFNNPKPTRLIRRMITLSDTEDKDGIVLDFFAGSGTTAEAVIRQNAEDGGSRKYILVQLPEPCGADSAARAAGYSTIADLMCERIRRVSRDVSAKTRSRDDAPSLLPATQPRADVDCGFRVFALDSSNIKEWDVDHQRLEEAIYDATESIKLDRSRDDLLYELLLKMGLDLCVPVEERQSDGKTVHSVGAGALVVCLEERIELSTVEAIAALKEELQPETMRVVFRDSGFKDDVVKTNAVQILKQAGLSDEHIRSI
ncbi:MAG: site-specific DNA-methyltransferase [Phycisphaerales bacterium JB040]